MFLARHRNSSPTSKNVCCSPCVRTISTHDNFQNILSSRLYYRIFALDIFVFFYKWIHIGYLEVHFGCVRNGWSWVGRSSLKNDLREKEANHREGGDIVSAYEPIDTLISLHMKTAAGCPNNECNCETLCARWIPH